MLSVLTSQSPPLCVAWFSPYSISFLDDLDDLVPICVGKKKKKERTLYLGVPSNIHKSASSSSFVAISYLWKSQIAFRDLEE